MNATKETPRRQAFIDACAPYAKAGYGDHFIRGYDDSQCGRPHAFVGGTCAGDAYVAGWNTERSTRTPRPAFTPETRYAHYIDTAQNRFLDRQ